MHLQEITAEQYLAILQMGGEAVCVENDLRFDQSTKEYFTRCDRLDSGYGDTMWQMWASEHSPY